MRSTNPIWRLAPVFGQLGLWNEKRTTGCQNSNETQEIEKAATAG
jgi:hypothetical protein